MAAEIPRNPQELAKSFEGLRVPSVPEAGQEFRQLQIAAGDLSSKYLAQAGIGAEFEAEMQRRLGAREMSPELRKREREAISQLFATPVGVRERIGAAGGAPVSPGAVSSVVAGRMNNYLSLLDNIRDERRSRERRIDDIVKDVRLTAEAGIEKVKAQLGEAERQEDRAWDVYRESVRQREFNQKLSDSSTASEKKITLKNSIIQEWNQWHLDKAQDPNWNEELNGTDPDFYADLVNQVEEQLGNDGVEWFTKKYPPGNYVLGVGDNYDRLEKKAGITRDSIAMGLSQTALKLDLFDALEQSQNIEDLQAVRFFYGKFLDLDKLRSEIRARVHKKFGSTEGISIMAEVFPITAGY